MPPKTQILPLEHVEELIHLLRGQKVLLDFDLATLYGVETRVLNQAVKRNLERFPEDFMFQLSEEDMDLVAQARVSMDAHKNSSQIVMSSGLSPKNPLKTGDSSLENSSQTAAGSRSNRGLTYRYYAFTEQGVAMLSSVLRSPRAVRVNIEIMRAFIRLRQWLASNEELTRKLNALEKKYDEQFKIVFQAIRELMGQHTSATTTAKREIGFHAIPGSDRARAKTKFKNSKMRTDHNL